VTLTSLASLHQRVRDGALSPGDAADLATTLLFDGMQAPRSGL
jgi:hypothetical protein